jgi:hypothetical protein
MKEKKMNDEDDKIKVELDARYRIRELLNEKIEVAKRRLHYVELSYANNESRIAFLIDRQINLFGEHENV